MNIPVSLYPRKTREMHNHHFDSTIWNDFRFRDDDIVIATYAKSGTTWAQQIVGQLLFAGDPAVDVAEMSPWLDLRVPPKEVKLAAVEVQSHRRFLKTHLPVDALVFSPKAKYIFVARDGRDVVWSLYNHHASANALWYELLNDTPGRVGPAIARPPASIREYFCDWLTHNGRPFWPFWENVRSWWNVRDLPNVLLVHFADLKADLSGQVRRIAGFLNIPVDEARFPAILEHCGFDWMKCNAARTAPLGGIFWDGGAEAFIHKGTNDRWRNVLTAQDIEAYESAALAELGPNCARWLGGGSQARGVRRSTARVPRSHAELSRLSGISEFHSAIQVRAANLAGRLVASLWQFAEIWQQPLCVRSEQLALGALGRLARPSEKWLREILRNWRRERNPAPTFSGGMADFRRSSGTSNHCPEYRTNAGGKRHGQSDIPPVRSKPAHEKQHDEDDQDNADDPDATVPVAVAIASEAAAEATEQGDDKDDDKNESQRHDCLPLQLHNQTLSLFALRL